MVTARSSHKSNFNICWGITILSIIDITPIIDNILNMLLPTILAITMLLCFLMEATIAVVSSGKQDPRAIIPSPMTSLLILNLLAMAIDPSRNNDEPIINNIIPETDINIEKGKFKFFKEPKSESIFVLSSSEKLFLSLKYE